MTHEYVLPVLVHVRPCLPLLNDVKLEKATVGVALLDYRVTCGVKNDGKMGLLNCKSCPE